MKKQTKIQILLNKINDKEIDKKISTNQTDPIEPTDIQEKEKELIFQKEIFVTQKTYPSNRLFYSKKNN